MGLFDMLKGKDINAYLEEYRQEPDALLVDVRTEEEYRQGHIPGSTHIPLQSLPQNLHKLGDKGRKIYVHCLSGGRSGQAVSFLRGQGYAQAVNIGGIQAYKGPVKR